MKIIAGLGNPGSKYEETRHNVGFMALDVLAEKLGIKINKIKFQGLIGEGRLGTERVVLLKPQTFMNNSGQSLRAIADFYKVSAEDIIVIVDDIDISFASLKIKKNGSAGTHNGLKSIVAHLGSKDFVRIKVGVGDKKTGEDLADFVLSRFGKEDRKHMDKAVEAAADAVEMMVLDSVDKAMNTYNNQSY